MKEWCILSLYCWCVRAGHQMSIYVKHMAYCLLLVPCALLSIVCPLPSCYPIIVSVAPPVAFESSPSSLQSIPDRTDQPIWGLSRGRGGHPPLSRAPYTNASSSSRPWAPAVSRAMMWGSHGVQWCSRGVRLHEAALKDVFNSALDEPLSCWRMRGQDHLTYREFVVFLARSPAKVAGVPQMMGDEAAAPQVAADEATVSLVPMKLQRTLGFLDCYASRRIHPWGRYGQLAFQDRLLPRQRCPLQSPLHFVNPQSPLQSPHRSVSPQSPQQSPLREPTESAPEPTPSREPTESAPEPTPSREPTESAPEPTPSREPTESTPEPTPFREPTESATEPAPWAHRVRSRARSVPWAHRVRSRARSVLGADAALCTIWLWFSLDLNSWFCLAREEWHYFDTLFPHLNTVKLI